MTEAELWLLFAAAAVAGRQFISHPDSPFDDAGGGYVVPASDPEGTGLFADQMVIQYRKRFGYDEDTPDGEEETSDEG